jgi:hypothetical protein
MCASTHGPQSVSLFIHEIYCTSLLNCLHRDKPDFYLSDNSPKLFIVKAYRKANDLCECET